MIEDAPYAWIFFVSYIVVAFIVLNLIIGVIVTTMEEEVTPPLGRDQRSNCTSTNRSCSAWQLSDQVAVPSAQLRPGVAVRKSQLPCAPTESTRHENGPPPNEGEGPEEKQATSAERLERAHVSSPGPWGLNDLELDCLVFFQVPEAGTAIAE